MALLKSARAGFLYLTAVRKVNVKKGNEDIPLFFFIKLCRSIYLENIALVEM